MEPDKKLPGKTALTLPGVLHYVGGIVVLIGLGATTNPDYANSLGIPGTLLGLLTAYSGKVIADWNQRKTTEAHVEAKVQLEAAKLAPAAAPDGVDAIAHGLSELQAVAASKKLKELVAALSKAIEIHANRGDN